MRSKKLAISFSLIVVLALVFGFALPCVLDNTAANNVAYAATSVSNSTADWTTQYNGSYYNNINANATGSTLRSQVAKLISDTHKHLTGYDDFKTLFYQTDGDPNNSNNIIWFYTGTSVPFKGTWDNGNYPTNREHVWPKNGGSAFPEKTGPGGDAHHIRPLNSSMNSTRGSLSYDEVTTKVVALNGSTSYGNLCYTNGTFFYPGKGYRGATARILFYMQTRWGDQYGLSFVDAAGHNKTIGKISTLMKWHLEEPPTDEEIRRNEVVFGIQGNRNPFIDHPEYAAQIYCNDGQSYNNALKQVVAKYGNYNDERPDVESLALNNTSLTLSVGQTQTLSVSVTPADANASVTWSTSNASVATVSNGVVTAKANGTATITATSVSNPNIKTTATVTVKGVTSIEITGEPIKKIYESGQTFDPTGLTVKLIYSDGSSQTYSEKSDLARLFYWYDANTGKTQITAPTSQIKCVYGSVQQVLTLSKPLEIKTATRMELLNSPSQLIYEEGDVFNPNGLTVRIHYNDGAYEDFESLSELRSFTWTDSVTGSTELGKDTTTIRCSKDNLSVTSTWSVTIKKLASIAILGSPTVTAYQAGQIFDPTGLTVRLTYSDNTTRDLDAQTSSQICEWVDADTDHEILVEQTTKIKVRYQGLSQLCDFTVTVSAPPDTVSGFINSVIAIDSSATLRERFAAIKLALIEYDRLSDVDKDNLGAQGAYQTLMQAIDSYNAEIAAHNGVMESATGISAYAISAITLAGVALVFVLRKLYY